MQTVVSPDISPRPQQYGPNNRPPQLDLGALADGGAIPRDRMASAGAGGDAHMVAIPWTEYQDLQERARKAQVASSEGGWTTSLRECANTAAVAEDLGHMKQMEKLPLPEGARWGSDPTGEKRSINRFLYTVMQLQKKSGLDAKSTFHYLTTRCVDEDMGLEIGSNCPSLESVPINYGGALSEAEAYLRMRFARTNRSDRFTEKVESGDWAKDAANMTKYWQAYTFVIQEGQLLGVTYDLLQRRRIYINALPGELKKKATELLGWMREMPLNELHERLEDWMDASGVRAFKAKPAPSGVRALGKVEEEPESGTCAAAGSAQAGAYTGKRKPGMECFHCKGDHFKRECPLLHPQGKADEPNKAASEAGTGQPAAPRGVRWGCTVLAAAAGSETGKVMNTVSITSQSKEAPILSVRALFDTGADVSMATRKFVDELLEAGVIEQHNAKPGMGPELLLADGTPMGKPLGTVEVMVEGQKADLVVVENLCCSMIVGKDLMRSERAETFMVKLVSALKGCDENEAVRIIGAATVVTPAAGIEEMLETPAAVVRKAHCDYAPIQFQWKPGAKESLQCNLRSALAEARQKEKRMEPGLLNSYNQILRMWEEEGWLVPIPLREAKFFLRHFPVVRDPNGATPMKRCRVVVEGSSLTELLDVPPCSHTDLLKNLVLWRTAQRFACLDISQAYMRVQISQADSKYMCIAWQDRALAFRSLPMGVSPSAQALQAIVDKYVVDWEATQVEKAEEVACHVRVAPYMDDLTMLIWPMAGGEAKVDLDEIEGDFSRELATFFTEKGLNIAQEKTVRSDGVGTLLGVPFARGQVSVAAGRLKPAMLEEVSTKPVTRRRACSMLAAVFDPLGLVAEVGMQARLLAAKFSGIAWNGVVPSPLVLELKRWLQAALRATSESQPRLLSPFVQNRVFVFCDASAVGYGVVVAAADGSGVPRRLYSKGRLYQKHQKLWVGSSPKIELLGLKLAVETILYLRKVFDKVPTWGEVQFVVGTDSEVNFQRLASADSLMLIEDRWQRIGAVEVCNVLAKHSCLVYHIPGPLNPADAVSRGVLQGDAASVTKAAVEWFNLERAVAPKRYLGCVDDVVPERDTGEDAVSVDSYPEHSDFLVVGAVRTRQGVTETPVIAESLSERFARESAGRSRQEWMAAYQAEDVDVAKLAQDKLARLQNGVWVMTHRQELDGSPLHPIVIPKSLRANALRTIHEAGHLGVRKSIARARDLFWWKGMSKEVKAYCLHCPICQEYKGYQNWKTEPGYVRVEGSAWRVVGVDTVKAPDGVILTATCLYSRFVMATVVRDERASTLAGALEKWFLQEGAPAVLASDNGTYFRSAEFQRCLEKWGVTAKFSPRYSPWYGGFFEISHRTLMAVLAALVADGKSASWRGKLAEAVLYYNQRPFEDGLSPFEVFKGRRIHNPWNSSSLETNELWPSDEVSASAALRIAQEREAIHERFEITWKELRATSMREVQRKGGRLETFTEGQYVYVWIPPETRDGKLGPRWEGPFRVDKVLGGARFQVGDRVEHSMNMKRAYLESYPGGRAVEDETLPNPEQGADHSQMVRGKESTQKTDKPRAGKRKAEGDAEEGQPAPGRVQPPRAAKLKKARLAALLLWRPKGDLLWL